MEIDDLNVSMECSFSGLSLCLQLWLEKAELATQSRAVESSTGRTPVAVVTSYYRF